MVFKNLSNDSNKLNVCSRILSVRLHKIILITGLILITVTVITHYYLTNVDSNSVEEDDIHRTRLQLQVVENFGELKGTSLKMRIEELLRIKASVGQELRQMEEKRSKLQLEISNLGQKIDDLKSELIRHQMELDRVKISVQQAQVAYQEALQRNTPELAAPIKILPLEPPQVVNYTLVNPCLMATCWDYSRCSVTSGFPVYFYKDVDWEMEGFLSTTMLQVLGYNPHIVRDGNIACAYLVLLGEVRSVQPDPEALSKYLKDLRYWAGDGRNHILLYLTRSEVSRSIDRFAGTDTGRAIIMQSTFKRNNYRKGFDIVVPPVLGPPGGDIWHQLPYMLPARRKYLASFQGQAPNHGHDAEIVAKLKGFVGATSDEFLFDFVCPLSNSLNETGDSALDWGLCGTESMRLSVLKESTFAIILAPSLDYVSTTLLQTRLFEATRSGAIPVILGGDQVHLSFDEVLSWRRAAFLLSRARVSELHFVLRSVSDADVLSMRAHARALHHAYLATAQAQLDTALATLRDRLGLPPPPAPSEPSPSIFNSTFSPLKTEVLTPESDPEESLGPLEPPYSSPAYLRNFTVAMTQGYELWNVWIGAGQWLYPQLPFDPVLPSDSKFIGSQIGFRPIGGGSGGAGKEFAESLGGNHPREQFTIVMLTYEREQVLINSISRLYGLPYLNKVVVVWNSPRTPVEDFRWPDIGVPVQIIRARRNSLNNRFLPYDAIETEAVLSVDDDAHLRHDEIMFGFRVWREKRDRIVGFPGRFHAWDLNHGGWLYNSNYSCELSMVLTGAAFLHKYYMYLYTYWLPQAIRDKVDEYMNCEDIAINFLVSHFTRQPPIKVTSRWTFRCPGCPVSLSEDDTHFQERHKCIQFFTQVFGYTPLLNTQFRADSILFKTRIPHDKQKCFKFI